MMEINTNELKNIKAGSIKWGLVGLIGGIVAFVIGAVEGLIKLKWQDLKNIVFIRNLSEKPLIQIRKKDSIMFIKS